MSVTTATALARGWRIIAKDGIRVEGDCYAGWHVIAANGVEVAHFHWEPNFGAYEALLRWRRRQDAMKRSQDE